MRFISSISFVAGLVYLVLSVRSLIALAGIALIALVAVMVRPKPLVSKRIRMIDWEKHGIPYGYDQNNVPWRLDQATHPAELFDLEGRRIR
jgi:hypothetical protein